MAARRACPERPRAPCAARPSTHDELIAQKGTYYQLYTGAFELE